MRNYCLFSCPCSLSSAHLETICFKSQSCTHRKIFLPVDGTKVRVQRKRCFPSNGVLFLWLLSWKAGIRIFSEFWVVVVLVDWIFLLGDKSDILLVVLEPLFICEMNRVSREDIIHRAKLAEKAERYPDMAQAMKAVAETDIDLSNDERNLFSISYKHTVGRK